jgi:excinuclease UvrABC nuclease subunit
MAAENAKLLYLDYAAKKTESASVLLQKALGLRDVPHSIEGIDVSNLQGTNPAIALVHFADERPLKARYRLYYPKTVEGQNDFAMIYETVLRRFGKPDPPPPDSPGGVRTLGQFLALGIPRREVRWTSERSPCSSSATASRS